MLSMEPQQLSFTFMTFTCEKCSHIEYTIDDLQEHRLTAHWDISNTDTQRKEVYDSSGRLLGHSTLPISLLNQLMTNNSTQQDNTQQQST